MSSGVINFSQQLFSTVPVYMYMCHQIFVRINRPYVPVNCTYVRVCMYVCRIKGVNGSYLRSGVVFASS